MIFGEACCQPQRASQANCQHQPVGINRHTKRWDLEKLWQHSWSGRLLQSVLSSYRGYSLVEPHNCLISMPLAPGLFLKLMVSVLGITLEEVRADTHPTGQMIEP